MLSTMNACLIFLAAICISSLIGASTAQANKGEHPVGRGATTHDPFRDHKNHSEFHTNLGLRHYNSGNLDRAIEDLTFAIKIRPAAALPFYHRGNAHFRRREFEAAIRDYTNALDRHPNFAMAMANRGNARSALGRLDAALEDFDSVIKLEPDNTYALFNRGFLFGKRRRYHEAIEDFSRLIELAPDNVRAHELRAAAYSSIGELTKATADMVKASQLRSKQRGE